MQSFSPATQNIPFSQEAEEAVIGAVLVNPAVLPALAFLEASDFFLLRNSYIWQALLRLQAKGGSIDYLTVTEEVKSERKLEDIGGEFYLAGMFRNTPTSLHAEAYAHIVETAALRRHLMVAADEIRGLAMNENMELEEVIANADRRLYEATARHTSARRWSFKSRAQIMDMPDVEWLIPNLLPVRSLGMVFGVSGTFKSFWALDKSIDVAQKKNVLYIVAEGEAGTKTRLKAHEHHFKKSTERLSYCLGAVSLFSDVDMTSFKREAARHKPELIVVDTFAMCTGDADENNTRDMKTIVDGCQRMIAELGCSVLVVHHTNKAGKEERGNASFRNACDTVIRLSLLDDVIKVEHQKSKDKAMPKPEYFRRVVVDLGYTDSDGVPQTSVVLEPSERVIANAEPTEKQLAVMRVVAIEPSASMNDISDIVEASRSAVQSIIEKLTKRGFLSPWDGKSRTVTRAGLVALGDSPDSPDSPDSTHTHTHAHDKKTGGVGESQGESGVRQNVLFSSDKNYYNGGDDLND
jgi:hypothetical protein